MRKALSSLPISQLAARGDIQHFWRRPMASIITETEWELLGKKALFFHLQCGLDTFKVSLSQVIQEIT